MRKNEQVEAEAGTGRKRKGLHLRSAERASKSEGADSGQEHRKRLLGIVPWGKHAGPEQAEEGRPAVGRRARAAVHDVSERSRQGVSRLRERAPTGAQLRAQAEDLRAWAQRGVGAQPLAVGLGALAIGFGAAALLPASRVERKALDLALGAAGQLDTLLDKAGKLAEGTVGKLASQEESDEARSTESS
ncbi:MAG: hypothetical protein WBV82_02185 [Myxococcaceae bacterium]